MLRFLALLTLRCFACFLLIGVLISRAWGWSEYASPELYVVYFQIIDQRIQYFVVNADGSSAGEPLMLGDDALFAVDCSPDGRVFAFLTEGGKLYGTTREGVVEHGIEDRAYNTVNAANDGTLALFDPAEGWLQVDATVMQLSAPDEPNHLLDRVDISPQGLVLWTRHFSDIQVVAPGTGEVLAAVPRGYSAVWLAAGQMFTFYDLVTDPSGIVLYGGQYVMDVPMRKAIRVGGWTMTRPLSPDGTKVAGALALGDENRLVQVVVYDLFSNANRRQLTNDLTIAAQPICFLTFRPDMLIAR